MPLPQAAVPFTLSLLERRGHVPLLVPILYGHPPQLHYASIKHLCEILDEILGENCHGHGYYVDTGTSNNANTMDTNDILYEILTDDTTRLPRVYFSEIPANRIGHLDVYRIPALLKFQQSSALREFFATLDEAHKIGRMAKRASDSNSICNSNSSSDSNINMNSNSNSNSYSNSYSNSSSDSYMGSASNSDNERDIERKKEEAEEFKYHYDLARWTQISTQPPCALTRFLVASYMRDRPAMLLVNHYLVRGPVFEQLRLAINYAVDETMVPVGAEGIAKAIGAPPRLVADAIPYVNRKRHVLGPLRLEKYSGCAPGAVSSVGAIGLLARARMPRYMCASKVFRRFVKSATKLIKETEILDVESLRAAINCTEDEMWTSVIAEVDHLLPIALQRQRRARSAYTGNEAALRVMLRNINSEHLMPFKDVVDMFDGVRVLASIIGLQLPVRLGYSVISFTGVKLAMGELDDALENSKNAPYIDAQDSSEFLRDESDAEAFLKVFYDPNTNLKAYDIDKDAVIDRAKYIVAGRYLGDRFRVLSWLDKYDTSPHCAFEPALKRELELVHREFELSRMQVANNPQDEFLFWMSYLLALTEDGLPLLSDRLKNNALYNHVDNSFVRAFAPKIVEPLLRFIPDDTHRNSVQSTMNKIVESKSTAAFVKAVRSICEFTRLRYPDQLDLEAAKQDISNTPAKFLSRLRPASGETLLVRQKPLFDHMHSQGIPLILFVDDDVTRDRVMEALLN